MTWRELEAKYDGFGCTEVNDVARPPPDLDRSLARFFASREPLPGPIRRAESRGQSFSALLGLRAPMSVVFHACRENRIRGVASLSLRRGYVGGRPGWVGFLGDLQIEFERVLLGDWRRFYGDLLNALEKLPTSSGTVACLSCVPLSNERALRALIRPHRLSPYRYRHLGDVDVVEVLGRAPLGFLRSPVEACCRYVSRLRDGFGVCGLRVREARECDTERIVEFLDEQQRRRAFGHVFAEELPRRFRCWPGFELARFLIVEDRRERIVATAAPWSPGVAHSQLAEQVSRTRLWAERALSRLPKPKSWRIPRLPREGEELETLHLTHLEFDLTSCRPLRELALRLLIVHALERHASERWNFLAFADFAASSLRSVARGLYWRAVPYGLYSVHPLDDASGLIRNEFACGAHPPAFEPALI